MVSEEDYPISWYNRHRYLSEKHNKNGEGEENEKSNINSNINNSILWSSSNKLNEEDNDEVLFSGLGMFLE